MFLSTLQMFSWLQTILGTAQQRTVARYRRIVAQVNRWDAQFSQLSDEELLAKSQEFKRRLAEGETTDQLLPEAYGAVKAACRKLCGTQVHVSGYDQQWDMVPYDVQLVAAIAMHHGAIAEAQTGEGKTLVAALPLYLRALTGKPCHLVTINDYLAQRDCQWMGPIYRKLGLTVGSLTSGLSPQERKTLYQLDILYGTASEFGFDYLRDNSLALRKEDQVQRGHYFAIIDEVDSILVDEARTPLIISGPSSGGGRQMYDTLKEGVAELVKGQTELCSRIATEARKVLERLQMLEGAAAERKLTREEEKEADEALRKLWVVSKGMPRNRILRRVRENPELRVRVDGWDVYYVGEQNKEERAKVLGELLIVVDERANEYELTDKGIAAWRGGADDFVMLDLGHEYDQIDRAELSSEEKLKRKTELQAEDGRRKERAHNLRQMLRAHLLMERDVDYIVQENKVVIIDENTGRPQPGRRFSDGLHQAIEAKEQVAIQQETQTYATITLQNYFRMYSHLAGMTGTAITEAHEFKEIYKLEVVQIPPHRPPKRVDHNDEVYMTEREKYHAILKEIREAHAKGQPVLVGTESVEASEKLARILRQNQLEHVVLNAKQHQQEAEIVARAGQMGAITIATNMAGRGTDIKLGPGVADVGGLYVVGTTRHQSRRIDRQLRGRSGRQGDPGASKFFVSFDDQLMRLFASPRLNALLKRLRPPENEPITAKILNRAIETAQKRVEQRNYIQRKHTLEYDDVMNRQRREIYSFRNAVLQTPDTVALARELLMDLCEQMSERFLGSRSSPGNWDLEGYRQWLVSHFPVSLHAEELEELDGPKVTEMVTSRLLAALDQKLAIENGKASAARVAHGLPPLTDTYEPVIYDALRHMMLSRLDQLWQEHLLGMDHLRSEVSLRTVGQKDPLMEFKQEAFIRFEDLGRTLRTEIGRTLFRFQIVTREQMRTMPMQQPKGARKPQPIEEVPPPALEAEPPTEMARTSPLLLNPAILRTLPCPCGSSQLYANCCGAAQ
jgi:preprotein translocase subunit SecA